MRKPDQFAKADVNKDPGRATARPAVCFAKRFYAKHQYAPFFIGQRFRPFAPLTAGRLSLIQTYVFMESTSRT
ncbi:hypothetical protein SDC9_116035 [bioreactor metagenome]|uniref:Uncharacterized protein n=1 Tax=bioreactor metagenome TaxID=1076179 RepID=A0A645BWS1_9ZZZZ